MILNLNSNIFLTWHYIFKQNNIYLVHAWFHASLLKIIIVLSCFLEFQWMATCVSMEDGLETNKNKIAIKLDQGFHHIILKMEGSKWNMMETS